MKKRILAILLCGVMIFELTGCKTQKSELNIGKKSDIIISQNDVVLSIKRETLTKEGCTLVLKNTSEKNFEYGDPYEIEIKKNGKWYKINNELNFNLPAYLLNSKETKEIEVNWEYGYGKLPKGTYRIIKSIDYEYEQGKYEFFYTAAEFVIE